MPPKYAPLARYLAAQPGDRLTLILAELEVIIGRPLPAGARRRHWWTSTPGRSAVRPAVWAAGWQIVLDGFWGRTPVVTFVREGSDAPRGQA